jgi:hypothetical protein
MRTERGYEGYTNGNGNTPSWLRAAVMLGAPAVIAMGLTYWVTQVVDTTVQATYAAIKDHISEQRVMNAYLSEYLYAICLNTSSGDEVAIARCGAAGQGHEIKK